jgi:hypothetical protein
MIKVDQHCKQKNHVNLLPVVAEKYPGDQSGHQQMKAVVEEMLQKEMLLIC